MNFAFVTDEKRGSRKKNFFEKSCEFKRGFSLNLDKQCIWVCFKNKTSKIQGDTKKLTDTWIFQNFFFQKCATLQKIWTKFQNLFFLWFFGLKPFQKAIELDFTMFRSKVMPV